MDFLERLNRTFKHEFVCRHELNTLADLEALLPSFQRGYNEQRLHSRLEYRPPPFWLTGWPLYSLNLWKTVLGQYCSAK